MECSFFIVIGAGLSALWSYQSRFFFTIGMTVRGWIATLSSYCRNQSKEFLQLSPLETVPGLVLLNIMLQTFDGIATYHGLSLGVQEGNPIMRAAMMQWGVAETLLSTKGAACLMLPAFLFVRPRRLSVFALALLATAYLTLSFVPWLAIFFSEAQQIIWV